MKRLESRESLIAESRVHPRESVSSFFAFFVVKNLDSRVRGNDGRACFYARRDWQKHDYPRLSAFIGGLKMIEWNRRRRPERSRRMNADGRRLE